MLGLGNKDLYVIISTSFSFQTWCVSSSNFGRKKTEKQRLYIVWKEVFLAKCYILCAKPISEWYNFNLVRIIFSTVLNNMHQYETVINILLAKPILGEAPVWKCSTSFQTHNYLLFFPPFPDLLEGPAVAVVVDAVSCFLVLPWCFGTISATRNISCFPAQT